MKTNVSKNTKGYKVEMTAATEGELIALVNALAKHGETSPVGHDLSVSLRNALQREGYTGLL